MSRIVALLDRIEHFPRLCELQGIWNIEILCAGFKIIPRLNIGRALEQRSFFLKAFDFVQQSFIFVYQIVDVGLK